jgi:hypothetical protein
MVPSAVPLPVLPSLLPAAVVASDELSASLPQAVPSSSPIEISVLHMPRVYTSIAPGAGQRSPFSPPPLMQTAFALQARTEVGAAVGQARAYSRQQVASLTHGAVSLDPHRTAAPPAK